MLFIHRGRHEAFLHQYQSSCPSQLLAFHCSLYSGSSAFHALSIIPGRDPFMIVWKFTQQYRMCNNHIYPQKNIIFFLHLSWTWVSRCLSGDLEQGTSLSWLSVPVATWTDVLFNTTAGRNLGWSEYKLSHCLQWDSL